ncbi:serine/threonine-protein kinase [Streptomyces sp. NPDC006798]|uniref:serine/threonine-protein kinase n=1 Tax=Streptomyces sp. NPDC006798 TaxID=3155462 RepID=UPI0033E0FEF7
MENTRNTGEGVVLAGRYRLGESIGRGGMGRVWRARDEVLHRVVAVKELTAGMYASESDRARLHARTQKEARAAARITHPGVVTVHDVLEHDDRPWIVMQYVEGRSLADATKESGGLPALETARIGQRVLDALGAAHAAGVLHRDVKPANVLLARDGGVLLTDFGIAVIEGDSTITRTGEIVGSIDYVAPERVRGGDPGPACDLWSLGVTLYSAVTGESPFRRTSPLGTMRAVVAEEPGLPRGAGALGPVVMALLAKEPEARPGAAEAARMLSAAVAELERAGTGGSEGATAVSTAVLPPEPGFGSGFGPGFGSGGTRAPGGPGPDAPGGGSFADSSGTAVPAGSGGLFDAADQGRYGDPYGSGGVTGSSGPAGTGDYFRPGGAVDSPEYAGLGGPFVPGDRAGADAAPGSGAGSGTGASGTALSGTSATSSTPLVPASVGAAGPPGTSATTPNAVPQGSPDAGSPAGGGRGRKRNAKGTGGGRKGGRTRLVAAVVALSAIVGATAGIVAMRYADGDDEKNGTGTRTPTTATAGVDGSTQGGGKPLASTEPGTKPGSDSGSDQGTDGSDSTGEVPPGWKRVKDPLGFSLVMPKDWQRITAKEGQVDYSPDGGRHLLRININKAPKFMDQYEHALVLEKSLRQLPDYERVTLERDTFRGHENAAVLKFSWTEKTGSPGPRYGADQLYVDAAGTEYAIFLAGPVESREKTRTDFETIRKSWQGPADR